MYGPERVLREVNGELTTATVGVEAARQTPVVSYACGLAVGELFAPALDEGFVEHVTTLSWGSSTLARTQSRA